MNGVQFIQAVVQLFADFLRAAGFEQTTPPSISGRLYSVDFDALNRRVSIAYEPGDDYLTIYVFAKKGGALSDIDDRAQTLTLAALNERFAAAVSPAERIANQRFFSWFTPESVLEKRLLKAAKDLRLGLIALERDAPDPMK